MANPPGRVGGSFGAIGRWQRRQGRRAVYLFLDWRPRTRALFVLLTSCSVVYWTLFGCFFVSVTLAAGIAEDGGTVEGQVEGRCELAVRVGKEADARLASGVLGSTPGTHAESMSVMCRSGGYQVRFQGMAKKVDRPVETPSSKDDLKKI